MPIKEIISNLELLIQYDIVEVLSPKLNQSLKEAVKVLKEDEEIIRNFRTYREEE